MAVESTDQTSARIAKSIRNTLLNDQLARGESLNQGAAALADLGGVARLRWKGTVVVLSAFILAVGVIFIVAATID